MVRQAVRQAHGPEQSRRTHHHSEPSRRANHNDRNSKFQTIDGYPPSRVRRLWYLTDIHCLIVIPAQAGIQKMGKSDFLRNHQIWILRFVIYLAQF
jgi:hypothetical protein